MPETSPKEGPRTLSTVETNFEIIEALEELDGARVTELAEHLNRSKGGIYNHLATLRKHGYVVKNGEAYVLSLKFMFLGEYTRHQSRLYLAGKKEAEKLAERTGEFVHLMAEQRGRGAHVYNVSGEDAVAEEFFTKKRTMPDYLHSIAAGKAVLAYLPEAQVESIIEQYGLQVRTKETITDRETLLNDLESVRERGYAYNDEEEIRGLRAVGAPILNNDGSVLGAISVSGPVSRLKGDVYEEEIPEQVMRAANVIELNVETEDEAKSLDLRSEDH